MMPETTNHREEAIQGNGAAHAPAPDDATRRAEEMIDRVGDQIGQYAKQIGRSLLRLTARAREEVEDMWAEAQSIRRGDRP